MERFLLKSLFYGITTLGLIACNAGHSQEAQTKNTFTLNSESNTLRDSFDTVTIGSGFNSITKKAASFQSCLRAKSKPDSIYISNPTGVLDFALVQDMSELQDELGVDVSGKFGGDRFGFSTVASFAKKAKGNNYTTNFVYLYKYAGRANFVDGVVGESDAALTSAAMGMVHNDQHRFKQMCGDQFVSAMDAGATLAIKLALSFNSHKDQEKFNTQIKGDMGIASIASTIRKAATNAKVHVGFSLSALQMGGQPQNLNDIFGTKEPSGNYPFIDCGSVGGASSVACDHMMSAIINYGQTIRAQVADSTGKPILQNLYYTNPSVISYDSIGVKIGAVDPSPETLQAMQQLTHNYDKAVYDYTFATHYLTALRGFLDTPTQSSLDTIAKKLYNQIYNVYQSPTYNVINCYKDSVSNKCPAIKRDVDQALIDYAFSPFENLLLDYLETTSYSADLYTYNGLSAKLPTAYSKTNGCILAPVSAPNYARYALYCDGNWLKPVGDNLLVNTNRIKGGINISGLAYYFVSSTGYQGTITYPDLHFNEDSINPNNYYAGAVNILVNYDKESNLNLNSGVGLTRLKENQA